MTEQDAHIEASDFATQVGVTDDWFVDVLTVKFMKWYHQGGIDALSHAIARLGPKGETNIVRTLGEEGRIVP